MLALKKFTIKVKDKQGGTVFIDVVASDQASALKSLRDNREKLGKILSVDESSF